MRLSFPGSFSLVRFFWRSKRNEHQLKKEECPFETAFLTLGRFPFREAKEMNKLLIFETILKPLPLWM
jgi:hypothetical protein